MRMLLRYDARAADGIGSADKKLPARVGRLNPPEFQGDQRVPVGGLGLARWVGYRSSIFPAQVSAILAYPIEGGRLMCCLLPSLMFS